MADVELPVALDSDPEVMRYLSRTPTSRQEVEGVNLPMVLGEYAESAHTGSWAALDRETGQFLGWFARRTKGRPGEAELGYRLRRAAWGRAFATEGGRALINRAFARQGVERVRAQTMAVNVRSRRVMEKLGMRHVRTFHEHFDDPLPGTGHGEVEYAMTRAEWLATGRS